MANGDIVVYVPYLSVTIIHLSHICNCLGSVHFNYIHWRTQPAHRTSAAALYIIALWSFQVAEAIIITIAAGIVISRDELMRNWKKHSRNHKDFHCAPFALRRRCTSDSRSLCEYTEPARPCHFLLSQFRLLFSSSLSHSAQSTVAATHCGCLATHEWKANEIEHKLVLIYIEYKFESFDLEIE